jgi:hypothetical protein
MTGRAETLFFVEVKYFILKQDGDTFFGLGHNPEIHPTWFARRLAALGTDVTLASASE